MGQFAGFLGNIPFLAILLVGCVGYWIASGGYRTDYNAFHTVAGVLAFVFVGAAAQQFFRLVLPCGDSCSVAGLVLHAAGVVVAAAAVTIGCAVLWRKYLADWVSWLFGAYGIATAAFGPPGTWDSFSRPANRKWSFVAVTLLDGTVLECRQAQNRKLGLPELTTDAEGNLLFVATGKLLPETRERVALQPKNENGDIVFTYVPSSQIAKIDVHVGEVLRHTKRLTVQAPGPRDGC